MEMFYKERIQHAMCLVTNFYKHSLFSSLKSLTWTLKLLMEFLPQISLPWYNSD